MVPSAPNKPQRLGEPNDFGFSTTDESTIIQTHVAATSGQLQQIWDLINPLLTNLQKDPDKDVLKWPNRAAVIKKLQDQLRSLCSQ